MDKTILYCQAMIRGRRITKEVFNRPFKFNPSIINDKGEPRGF